MYTCDCFVSIELLWTRFVWYNQWPYTINVSLIKKTIWIYESINYYNKAIQYSPWNCIYQITVNNIIFFKLINRMLFIKIIFLCKLFSFFHMNYTFRKKISTLSYPGGYEFDHPPVFWGFWKFQSKISSWCFMTFQV